MLVKSTPMGEDECVAVEFEEKEKCFDYRVPEGYKAVVHFVVDLYPAKQKVIFVPGSGHSKL